MFGEQDLAAGFQNTSHFLQRRLPVRNCAQDEGYDDRVDGIIFQRNGFCSGLKKIDMVANAEASRFAASLVDHQFGRLQRIEMVDLVAIIEREIRTRSRTDFQHTAGGLRHDFLALFHDRLGAAGTRYNVRDNVAIPRVH